MKVSPGTVGESNKVPVLRVRAALFLLSALVGSGGEPAAVDGGVEPSSTTSGDDVKGAAGNEGGLLEAVCELALATPRAPAGGGPTWAEYGLSADCQQSAMGVLSELIKGHPGNQVLSVAVFGA